MADELMDIDGAIAESFSSSEDQSGETGDDLENVTITDDNDGDDGQEGDDGESDDGDGEEQNKEGSEEKPKPKKNRAQERINALTKKTYELRQQLAELQAKVEPEEPELPQAPAAPNPRNFSTQEAYNKAVRDYDFAMGQHQAQIRQINSQREQADVNRIETEKQTYQQKIAADKGKYKDFDAVIQSMAHVPLSEQLHNTLATIDNPADLVYFLGKNPAIADGVLSLKGHAQTVKLAEISVKIKNAAKPKNLVSEAPKPASKVNGGGSSKNFNNLSFEQHCQAMAKIEAKQRNAMIA
jgi:hypothetical protein